ncbi:MAG: hypothetical protein GC137_08345 [Alphaproteobacteria bacterium]|nr:hypothetical protein [Alphaproteobacteria bacterium]
MISYYNAKHPGLCLYVALVISTVMSFLLIDMKPTYIGLLAMAWSVFVLMRVLSFYEITHHFTDFLGGSLSMKPKEALPEFLTHKMTSKNHLKRGMYGLNALHERTALWFVLGVFYVFYFLFSNVGQFTIVEFVTSFSLFFIVGASFWSGQTYAYSDVASRLLMIVFGLLFVSVVSVLVFQNELAFSREVILENILFFNQNTALPLLGMLAIYTVGILIYSSSYGLKYSLNAMVGVFILGVLAFCALGLEQTQNNLAIWASGWSLFSIFWIRSYSYRRTRYALYQGQ